MVKLPKELQKKGKNIARKRNNKNKQIGFSKLISEINKKCRFKGCLYPEKKECSKKVIKAHSVQRKRILSTIANDGHVLSFDVRTSMFSNNFEKLGIAEASTFFGFCGHHDTNVFSPIENYDYKGTKEQNFLFAYRACAFEYAALKSSPCITKELMKKNKTSFQKEILNRKLKKDKVDLRDFQMDLDKFSNVFSKEKDQRNYDFLYSEIFDLNYTSLIAVNSSFCLNYDFEGNQIYNPTDYNAKLPCLYLNIFPQPPKTHIILSTFSDRKSKYEKVISKLKSFDISKIEEVFTQIIITHCENFYISPKKWNEIPKKMRKLIVSQFKHTILSDPGKNYLNEKPILNLFRYLKR